jgi:hypothetical protein
VASLAVLAAAAAPASAQTGELVYEFADDAGMTSSSFTVPEGQAVRVRLYLRERDAAAPLLNADRGLGTGAVRVTYGAASAATIANPATDIALAVPPWSDGNTNGTDAVSGVVNLFKGGTEGVRPTDGRVFLGTFTFTGQRVGSVTLTAEDPNPGVGDNTPSFTNANPLDSRIDRATATLTVTPVPEPAAVLAVAAAGLAALGSVRRGRR